MARGEIEVEKREISHERSSLEDVVPLKAPFVLYIDPCGACNFKCGFCPCNISDYQTAERHKMMSWELFEKIAGDLQAFHGEIRVINLYSFGEPLLNPRIADMVRLLKSEHCCREVRITTNASLLDEAKSQALIEAGVDLMRVSVEALSTQDYRELCGINLEFSEIFQNVETFYRLSRNTDSKISIKMISATMKSEKDRQTFFDTFLPVADYCYIEDLSDCWAEFQEIRLPKDYLKAVSMCYQEGESKQICSFPFTDLCIHSNGVVGACCVDWKFATRYGDVNEQHLSEIWNGKEHLHFQRMHLERRLKEANPYCDACVRKSTDQIKDPELILENLKKN